LLQAGLVLGVDLARHAKQAHWNLKGSNFIALHELYDVLHGEATDHADSCAERLVALGGIADGTVQQVAKTTSLVPPQPVIRSNDADYVESTAAAIAAYGSFARNAIDKAAAFGDANTADLFTGISRALDQILWKVEAHHSGVNKG